MNPDSVASKIRRDIVHFGVVRTACRILMKGINLFVDFRIIRVTKREAVHPDYLDTADKAIQWQFLDESRLLQAARDPDNKLTESFVRTALARGDECYGGFDGRTLACFGWYSNKPTDDEGFTVYFNRDYIYGYSAVTLPQYRGKRLHAIRGNRALRDYLSCGFKGLVYTIDAHNFRARRSLERLGQKKIGHIVMLKIRSQAWMYTSRGCREQGFSLGQPAAAADSGLEGRSRRKKRYALVLAIRQLQRRRQQRGLPPLRRGPAEKGPVDVP